jgi:hypothetical protein
MNWSFIICTSDPNVERIDTCILSIQDLQIPNYEIIVVGGKRTNLNIENTFFLEFDETIRPGWITKKKNLGTKMSKFENLCIMHDYYAFDYNWYNKWTEFNSSSPTWTVASNAIEGINGQRIRTDWITWDDLSVKGRQPIPYNDWSRSKNQFISGGFFLVKRLFFLENPLDENLTWNQKEDVEWSLRIRDRANIVCNSQSIVRQTKWHRELNRWRRDLRRFEKHFGTNLWKN